MHLLANTSLFSLIWCTHSNICANQIHRWGTDAQKAKHLPDVKSGKEVGNPVDNERPHCFHAHRLCEKLDKMGMCGSIPCELVFEDYFVPDGENSRLIIGSTRPADNFFFREYWAQFIVVFRFSCLGLTWSPWHWWRSARIFVRLMQAAFCIAIDYVYDQEQSGQPVRTFQLMQVVLNAATRAKDCTGAILYSSDRAVEVTMEQCSVWMAMNIPQAGYSAVIYRRRGHTRDQADVYRPRVQRSGA
ncbi:2-methylacyl-CoA dehydrogenase, mitochondrial [Grifola frondosa]|uniref:2-methylacyl-CoA dehydrogenase, mitochondrial n=1 Tax=Grifola frondosa TaxID=5627 RepID=A0A1C7LWN4_GRIFR|nr:2-methylacyl-CoA dehydrogenase, mitochondrial [Grifola frondosa]